jgi:hypothetical protein
MICINCGHKISIKVEKSCSVCGMNFPVNCRCTFFRQTYDVFNKPDVHVFIRL